MPNGTVYFYLDAFSLNESDWKDISLLPFGTSLLFMREEGVYYVGFGHDSDQNLTWILETLREIAEKK